MKKDARFHRTVFFVFLVAAVLLLAPVLAATAGRGIVPVPVKDMAGKEVMLYKESHALVIGVSAYTEGWPQLPGALKDAQLVRQSLEQQGFDVTVVPDPDRAALLRAFDDFINRYGQEPDNRLLFYFAGHGHTMKLAYGAEMGYIVPRDAPNPNRDPSGFLARALSMQQIEVYARNIQAKHALFMFDSCFSGAIFATSRAVPENIGYKTSKPVRQFITAGGANETVSDESVFRGQFIAGLRGKADADGDGYVTGMELGEFLQKTVVNYSKGTQHPQYGKIRDPHLDEGDFVFSLGSIGAPRKSADLELERQKVETERLRVEEKRKLLEAEKKLAEERRKLEAEREQLARLEPPKAEPKPSPGPAGMVTIPGGTFYAGLQGEKDNPVLELDIGTFKMDKYEVTQAEFERVMGNNPSHFKGGNLPAESVTWHGAEAYCKKVGKRLPTEWEWEKAARGGTTTKYHWGDELDNTYGWWSGNSDGTTHPVGEKKPNQYGLYDMVGNVWEWTVSDYGEYGNIVIRGGSWDSVPYSARPAFRGNNRPSEHVNFIGFRCAQ
ncbi:MAG: SUMF1/EgtB/PvdO family nonheme iron enzyme [Nitrospinae bacterium]|nr:SUMF1/EgtB/PvdO family nonheme iron enzyme [Nitrospinota bacterium]